MLKKLISAVFCVFPMGLFAAPLQPSGGNSSVSTNQFPTDGSVIIIGGGNGLTVDSALSIDGSMYVGTDNDMGANDGDLVVLNTVNNPFTVQLNKNISIGSVLQVLNSWQLAFQSTGTGYDINAGSIVNNGKLNATNINTFNVGNIETSGDLNVSVNDIVDIDGLTVTGMADVDINAGRYLYSSGTIQNNYASTMDLKSTGNIEIAQNLENMNGVMNITGAGLIVDGTMTNNAQAGKIVLNNIANWTVNGGTGSYSFINNGDLDATVSGKTYFANGMNISGMNANTNKFDLTTGQLVFDANSSLINHLNSFVLNVTNGDLDVDSVINQSGATMDIDVSGDFEADNIINNGNMLDIDAQNITLNSVTDPTTQLDTSLTGGDGAETTLIASTQMVINGVVSNMGKMRLDSNAIQMKDVANSNTSATLDIGSLTDSTGQIVINGNITNDSGDTTIWAKDVQVIGSVINNGSIAMGDTLELRASGTGTGPLKIGAINANGGITNINSLIGSIDLTTNMIVGANGVLNLGNMVQQINVGGDVSIAGDVVMGGVNNQPGALNVAVTGNPLVITTNTISGDIDIDGNLNAMADSRAISLVSNSVNIDKNVSVDNNSVITIGDTAVANVATSLLKVDGQLNIGENGTVNVYSQSVGVGSLQSMGNLVVYSDYIVADSGNIDITGNVRFEDVVTPGTGLSVITSDAFTLGTTATDADVVLDNVTVSGGKELNIESADMVQISGVTTNSGTVDVDANGAVEMADISNTNILDITGTNIKTGSITDNGGILTIMADDTVTVGDIVAQSSVIKLSHLDTISNISEFTGANISFEDSVVDIYADTISSNSLVVDLGSVNLNTSNLTVVGDIDVTGNMVQGGNSGNLNLLGLTDVNAQKLQVSGDFIALSGVTEYVLNGASVGNVQIASGASSTFDISSGFVSGDVTNNGDLTILTSDGITMGHLYNNAGAVTELDSGAGITSVSDITFNGGTVVADGRGMNIAGRLDSGAMLYQHHVGLLSDNDINIIADDYTLSTPSVEVSGISQTDGKLTVKSSDIDVGGDIIATDLVFSASPSDNWMDVAVSGNVSGDVDFIGLGNMKIGGDYVFDKNSMINAAVLEYGTANTPNYWASINLNNDNSFGQITNATNGAALINVGGAFTVGTEYNSGFKLNTTPVALNQSQIGIVLNSVVDSGTAIWLLNARGGVFDNGELEKMRNLNVMFCNADGSLCTSLKDNWGAYLSVRDVTDANGNMISDGVSDSLYVVFDPRFGGPVLLENMKIQEIVDRVSNHTYGEYVSAGALDDMLIGQAHNKKFTNGAPIEIIPSIFAGTNMADMAVELSNRMEDYIANPNGDALARFSRLFQAHEIEHAVGMMSLNEHTSFRSFEDRMMDEFIWNRNRDLKKAWMDIDYGMFMQNIASGNHTDGHRFSMAGGFDWQESNRMILGLTGRLSHTSSATSDSMDLSYGNVTEQGSVHVDVSDTNIGLGGYMMYTMGDKARVYGNAFLDAHVFDVDRSQNFVANIDGDGYAFSLISEWGLLHDILNQYIVGNVYARVGYNFGMDIKETAGGSDYMRMESDGYLMLAPGYSLVAQKRIYPSAWFQIRPYASIGIEYDLLGVPDSGEYKFAPSESYTSYDIDISPMWANIGGGIELLSAYGLQFGVDYRYQYNNDIQLHNIKVSGSYRF